MTTKEDKTLLHRNPTKNGGAEVVKNGAMTMWSFNLSAKGMLTYNRIRGIILLAHDPWDTGAQIHSHFGSPFCISSTGCTQFVFHWSIFILNLPNLVSYEREKHPQLTSSILSNLKIAYKELLTIYIYKKNVELSTRMKGGMKWGKLSTWDRIIGPPCVS